MTASLITIFPYSQVVTLHFFWSFFFSFFFYWDLQYIAAATSLPALKWHSSSSFLYTVLDCGHLHRPAAYSSHGVRHPVDHVHHSESEREHSPGIDVDGVGIDGLADTLGTAFLFLLALLRLLGPSPPWLSLLATALPGYFAAGALSSALAAGNHHALVHASNRQREQNHSLFAILYYGL